MEKPEPETRFQHVRRRLVVVKAFLSTMAKIAWTAASVVNLVIS